MKNFFSTNDTTEIKQIYQKQHTMKQNIMKLDKGPE